jgi:hypothetical protein
MPVKQREDGPQRESAGTLHQSGTGPRRSHRGGGSTLEDDPRFILLFKRLDRPLYLACLGVYVSIVGDWPLPVPFPVDAVTALQSVGLIGRDVRDAPPSGALHRGPL